MSQFAWLLTPLLAAAEPPAGPQEPPVLAPRVLWTLPVNSHSFGAGAIADADGDGGLDVAFATYFGDATVRVLAGRSGAVLWSYHDPDPARDDCYDASLRFADVTGDGSLDLVVPCSSGCRVLCFAARDGRVQWSTHLGAAACTDSPPWIGDADGDGATDVVVGTFKSNLKVIRGSDGALLRTLEVAPSGAVQSGPLLVDLNGDGVRDLIAAIFGRADQGVYAIDGRDGARLWRIETPESIYHGPALGDVDGDGAPEIAVACYDGRVRLARAATGEVLWSAAADRYLMSPAVIVQLDGAGPPEIVAAGDRVTALRHDGSLLWQVAANPALPHDSVTRGVCVSDLDGDAAPDLTCLSGNGLLSVLRGRDGARLASFDAAPLLGPGRPASGCSHGPVIADLDGDGALDLFLVVGGGGARTPEGRSGPRYGLALALSGFPGRDSPAARWPMLRGDLRNTGRSWTE
jgi:outer membrane protein assembly factor BamB